MSPTAPMNPRPPPMSWKVKYWKVMLVVNLLIIAGVILVAVFYALRESWLLAAAILSCSVFSIASLAGCVCGLRYDRKDRKLP